MAEDFFAALSFAVKEEIVSNYFLQRQILDEESAEFSGWLEELLALEGRVLAAWERLDLLLAGPGPRQLFRRALGEPAASKTGWSLELPALTWRGRYRNLVRRAGRELGTLAHEHRQARLELAALAREINDDIDYFHKNFDFLALRSFICQLDQETLEKANILGSCLQGQACQDLEEALRFPKVKLPEERAGLPDPLPPKPVFEAAARRAADLAIREESREIRRLLADTGLTMKTKC